MSAEHRRSSPLAARLVPLRDAPTQAATLPRGAGLLAAEPDDPEPDDPQPDDQGAPCTSS
jgi:hypothetical protein